MKTSVWGAFRTPLILAITCIFGTAHPYPASDDQRARLERILLDRNHRNFFAQRTIGISDSTEVCPCTFDEKSCSLHEKNFELTDDELFSVLFEAYRRHQRYEALCACCSLLAGGAILGAWYYFFIYRPKQYYQKIINKVCAHLGPVKLQAGFHEFFHGSTGYATIKDGERIIGISPSYLATGGFEGTKCIPFTIYHEIGHHVHNDPKSHRRLWQILSLCTLGSAQVKPYYDYIIAPFLRHQEKQADLFAARNVDRACLENEITHYERNILQNMDRAVGRLVRSIPAIKTLCRNMPPLIEKLYDLATQHEKTFPRLANWIKHYCWDPAHPSGATRATYLRKVLEQREE